MVCTVYMALNQANYGVHSIYGTRKSQLYNYEILLSKLFLQDLYKCGLVDRMCL